MAADCIFCKIIAGKIPAKILYRDEKVIAFPDINPAAPVHLLIIPTQHIPSLLDLRDADLPIIGHMTRVANQMAREQGIAENGFRVVINCGKWGGQLVPHLHIHLLGGRDLKWSH